MAITHVKVTYSVQPQTAQRVQELAIKWGVPKSEVIRRAVDEATTNVTERPRLTPLQALNELMANPTISMAEAKRWEREIRLEREASGRKRGAALDREWKKYEKKAATRSQERVTSKR